MPLMTRYTHSRAEVAVNWRGHFVAGTNYRKDDMSHENGYIGISIGDNHSDRIAPVDIGDKQYSTTGITWNTQPEESLGVVRSGVRFVFTKGGFIESLYVRVPRLLAETKERIVILDITNPDKPVMTQIAEPNLVAGEWATVAVASKLVLPGTDLIIYIDAYTFSSSNTVTGGWTASNASDDAPTTQRWNRNVAETVVRIDKTDLDGSDRTSDLMSILAGASLDFVETGNPSRRASYTVETDPIDRGSYIEYNVMWLSNGVSGAPRNNQATTMTANTPVYQSTQYDKADGWWSTSQPTFAVAGGYLTINGEEPAGFDPNNAYGVDIQFQESTKSENWELIPTGSDVVINNNPEGIPAQQTIGLTGDFTIGHGNWAKTLHIVEGTIRSIS